MKKYCALFPGSDASIVRRSTALRSVRLGVPQFFVGCYMTLSSRVWLATFAVMGSIFAFLAKYEFGRRILKSAPGLFTLGLFRPGGPSEEEMRHNSFEMYYRGTGWSKAPSGDDRQSKSPDLIVDMKMYCTRQSPS